MTDLHTHILPGIDDGAIDEGVSSEQMKSLLEQGVDKVVFTSHYYGRKRSPKQFLEARADAFGRIKDLIPEGMETYLGAEVHFAAEMAASDESICAMAIGDTRYILAELPFATDWNKGLWRRLEDFISSTDYIPVIAHVERYDEARKKPALLSALVDMGCLLQVNTQAFLKKEDSTMAFALLEHGLVHCLGTDTHNMQVINCFIVKHMKRRLISYILMRMFQMERCWRNKLQELFFIICIRMRGIMIQ